MFGVDYSKAGILTELGIYTTSLFSKYMKYNLVDESK